MPVVKIPLEHKFGIVSLSRAESLLAQNRQKAVSKKSQRSLSPVEITQEFVAKYNEASDQKRKGFDITIQSGLQHAKYKAGLQQRAQSTSSPRDSVDVSSAWLELALLAQCFGQHQQDALLLLALSVNHAPLSTSHIPSLFYIAGLCYQWLKSDHLSGSILRTGELLLLRVLYLVCVRLHYHHLIGTLADSVTRDDMGQLRTDVEGFEMKEKSYRNFPEALLQWKVALEVGLLICEVYGSTVVGHTPLPPTSSELDSGSRLTDKTRESAMSKPGSQSVMDGSTHGAGLTPVLWHSLDLWQCVGGGEEALEEAISDLLTCSTHFDCERWLEGALAMCLLCVAAQKSIRILCLLQSLASGPATPPHSVSAKTTPTPLPESGILKDSSRTSSKPFIKQETRFNLPLPATSNTQETRVHKPSTLNVLGIQPEFDPALLGSAATLCTAVNHPASEQSGSGYQSAVESGSAYHSAVQSGSAYHSPLPSTVGTQSLIESEIIPDTPPSSHSSHSHLDHVPTDIELSADLSNADKNLTLSKLITVSGSGLEGTASQDTHGSGEGVRRVALLTLTAELADRVGLLDLHYPTHPTPSPLKGSEEDSQYTQSHAPLSDGVGVPGSQVAPSTVYRRSIFSTPNAHHLDSVESGGGGVGRGSLVTWSTEVTLLYTLGMADVVVYGQTSHIQRRALLGEAANDDDHRQYGLVQLSEFSVDDHQESSSKMGVSSWAVRQVALLGLARVNKVCGRVPVKDGFSHVAWSKLMDRHSSEEDSRVLEAFKISQACPDLDNALLEVDCHALSSPLLVHIADSLSRIFLPPVSTHTPSLPKPRKIRPSQSKYDRLPDPRKSVQTRVSSKRTESVLAAGPSFHTRTRGVLNMIAEEHWRRQMDEEARAREEEERAERERLRKEEEEKLKRKQEKLARNRPKLIKH